MAGLEVAVLGPVTAHLAGVAVALGTPRQRMVLTALALRRGDPVAPDTLADLVWGPSAPPSVENTLQGYVAGLRRALEPDRPPRAPAQVVVLGPGGYALRRAQLDVGDFEAGTDAVHQALGSARGGTGLLPTVTPSRAEELLEALDATMRLWRDSPYVELADAHEAAAERGRLGELRLLGLENRAALEIVLGREARVAADLEAFTAAHPLRERLWALRTLALARAGRQADALGVLRTVRTVLADELGIDPGAELSGLELAVLRQDPDVGPRPGRPARPPAPLVAESPLVGRRAERDRLLALSAGLTVAAPVRFAVVTGEAGVGKTRLVAELRAQPGIQVLTTRCPEDEGVPPLWSWSQLLAAAGVRLPTVTPAADPGARFRAWGESIDDLLSAVGDRPTLLVVEDLHWADASTLRILAQLAAVERPVRLLVVVTWRPDPAPSVALAELSARLARRHALRIHLGGLDVDDVAPIVVAAGGVAPTPAEARALHDRTGGNPFFLVELARSRPDEAAGSTGIHDLLAHRIGILPDEVSRTLEVAAVLGRDVDVATLAAVSDVPDDAIVERLERACRSGLVLEVGIDHFRFAHDLLRETVRDGVTRSRSARIHAAAAESLVRRGGPGTESEIARHWLAAGPAYADRAWRAARESAASALRLHAYEESAEQLRAALDAVDTDPAALAEDRCDLLLGRAEAMRLAGQWLDLRLVVHEALAAAHALDDTERAFIAATLPSTSAFWLASPYGEVDEVVVAALRRLLVELPAGDDPRRCRVMLGLASEIYYAATYAERDALVDEAVAMARRLGDDGLLLAALLGGATSVWRSSRSLEQHGLASEAVDLARALGHDQALVDALTTRAAAASDLGRLDELFADLTEGRAAATRQRLLFGLLVIDSIEICWRSMRGEVDAVTRLTAELTAAAESLQLAQLPDSFVAVAMMDLLWRARYDELLAVMRSAEADARVPVASLVAALLGRTGRTDELAAYAATHDLRPEVDDWLSPAVWSATAEAAMHLGDRRLAAGVYERLAPLAGRPASAGSGAVLGPVDMYLAMAARTVGEHDAARRHADDAERVAAQWRAEPVLRWVREERARWPQEARISET